MKKTIKMNERELHRLISESVKRVLNEGNWSTLNPETEKNIDVEDAWNGFDFDNNREKDDEMYRSENDFGMAKQGRDTKFNRNTFDHPNIRRDYVLGNSLNERRRY